MAPTVNYKQKYHALRRNILIVSAVLFFFMLWMLDYYDVLTEVMQDVSGNDIEDKGFIGNTVSVLKWFAPLAVGIYWLYDKVWPDAKKEK